MAKIYDEILKVNDYQNDDDLHSLNVFLSRLLFCFFAEDTGIFEKSAIFTNSVASYTASDGSDLHLFFESLFEVMNRPNHQRHSIPEYLKEFPYVNGGLFEKRFVLPKFSPKSRTMILDAGKLEWSKINPDIFGSMMQAVVKKEQRGALGMHYTSIPNIMKVIDPLFLDDLKSEFKNSSQNDKKLENLLIRLTKIHFFDPACGSGNFLIIAYKEMRQLEIKIFEQLKIISKQLLLPFSQINLSQFHGIEIDDFACEIAILSLWLAEHQMNLEFKKTFGDSKPSLPLKNGGNIICGNATRIDWETVCPKSKFSEIFILGNPPYLGARNQDITHKTDMQHLFTKNYKNLDYVTCWFLKAYQYIKYTNTQAAFVATNSICQGEQVSLFWPMILDGQVYIRFAHQSFKWTNNAKQNAGVTCVIVGLSCAKKERRIYKNNDYQIVKNITPYLTEGETTYVYPNNSPISNVPLMHFGNMPLDGGHLLLSKPEKENLEKKYTELKKYLRPLVGSQEFIKGIKRYCIWLQESDLIKVSSFPEIMARINQVKNWRLQSSRESTRGKAYISHSFGENRHQNTHAVIIPRVSSERRDYIPIGFLTPDSIISDSAQAIYEASPWLFGMLTSHMHMVWVRAVAGRLKTDYRYSSSLCYNTFPFPDLTPMKQERIKSLAYRILSEREKHSEKTIAELYDPNNMPIALKNAHHELDLVIDSCYQQKPFTNDEERLACLFKLYKEMTRKNQ